MAENSEEEYIIRRQDHDLLEIAKLLKAAALRMEAYAQGYPVLDKWVGSLDIPPRAAELLMSHGIETVRDLVESSARKVLEIPGLGHSKWSDINKALEPFGLYVGKSLYRVGD